MSPITISLTAQLAIRHSATTRVTDHGPTCTTVDSHPHQVIMPQYGRQVRATV